MTAGDAALAHARLRSQQLARSACRTAADVVAWFGAVQAQDYPAARWAVGQRTPRLTDALVERAFDAGEILRTHILRPTWHFVTPQDIRWMLALTAPRVQQAAAYSRRHAGVDASLIARSRRVLVRALRGGRHCTRAEIAAALARDGIPAQGTVLAHLLMQAELDAVICSGPRRGRQFTYALLEERAPATPVITREAALAELTWRYFRSHGPAAAEDYAWWSGLTVRDARAGIALVRPSLARETAGGREYWLASGTPGKGPMRPSAHLLPNYDEFLVAYRDRSASVAPPAGGGPSASSPQIFSNVVVIDGRVAGTWRRTPARAGLAVEARLLRRLAPAERRLLGGALDRFGRFLGVPITLTTPGAPG